MKVFWYPATEPEDDLYRGKVGPSLISWIKNLPECAEMWRQWNAKLDALKRQNQRK